MVSESSPENREPECVVVDTSVWRSELLLKTPLGVTLVYTLSRRGGVVALPEVIEVELRGQILEAGREAAEKAESPLHLLHTLMGDSFFVPNLPTPELLSRKVDERIAELASILVR